MRTLFRGFLFAMLLMPTLAPALSLFRVEKDGQVNWLLGTVHFRFENRELPKAILDTLGQAPRLILTEVGTDRNHLQLEDDDHEGKDINSLSRRRDIKRLLGPMDWLKFKRVFENANWNPQGLDYLPRIGLVLVPLEKAFTEHLLRAVQTRLEQMPGWEVALRKELEAEGYQTSPSPRDSRDWIILDRLIAELAQERGIPVESLDTPERAHLVQRSTVSDSDLKLFILRHLRRIDAIKSLPKEELLQIARLAIMNFDANTIKRYLRWEPGMTVAVQGLPETNSLPPPPPLLGPMASSVGRHTDWFPKIEQEFAKGGTLVAVGESHVVKTKRLGQTPDLIELLQTNGYQVTFLGIECARWL